MTDIHVQHAYLSQCTTKKFLVLSSNPGQRMHPEQGWKYQ